MSKFIFAFLTLALAAGFAESYKVTIGSPMTNGGQTLKAGDYKVEVVGQKAIFKNGKDVIEMPAVVEEGASKYNETRIETMNPGAQLKEIAIGGTKMKIIFQSTPATANVGGQ